MKTRKAVSWELPFGVSIWGVATRAVNTTVFEKKPGSRTDDSLAPRCGLRRDAADCGMRWEHLPVVWIKKARLQLNQKDCSLASFASCRVSGFATFP